jgi:hypothetical protein
MPMSRLEDELRKALRREEPPAGFAERVLAAVEAEKERASLAPPASTKTGGWWRGLFPQFPLRLAAGCAAALMIAAVGLEYRAQYQERARAEEAKEQVMTALRIAGTKIRFAQDTIHRISSR